MCLSLLLKFTKKVKVYKVNKKITGIKILNCCTNPVAPNDDKYGVYIGICV